MLSQAWKATQVSTYLSEDLEESRLTCRNAGSSQRNKKAESITAKLYKQLLKTTYLQCLTFKYLLSGAKI